VIVVRRLSLVAVVVVTVLMSLPIASTVKAATTSEQKLADLESQIKDLNAQIKAQKGDRTGAQDDLDAALAQLDAVRSDLAQAESKVQAVEASITDTESRLNRVQQELDELEIELADTRVRIRDTRDQVVDQAVEMYMGGVPGLQSVVFEARDMTSAVIGLSYAHELVQSSALLMNDLETLEVVEGKQKDAVEERKAAVQDALDQLGTQRDELEADREQVDLKRQEAEAQAETQQKLVNDINSQIRYLEAEKAQDEKDQAQIKAQIEAAQRRGGTAPSVLQWPVSGHRITSPFGWRVHPIFGTKKMHTGIDIGVPYGTPIKAAASGTVILAQSYGGYGNATAIDHGGGLVTLYGHQSKIVVKVGQKVDAGQLIGYVGCTGYCTGPHLHFEVREDGTPVNPLGYLP
jgi:murein DD-endopeptidase MepM/ murein hydrolase activator NlpD